MAGWGRKHWLLSPPVKSFFKLVPSLLWGRRADHHHHHCRDHLCWWAGRFHLTGGEMRAVGPHTSQRPQHQLNRIRSQPDGPCSAWLMMECRDKGSHTSQLVAGGGWIITDRLRYIEYKLDCFDGQLIMSQVIWPRSQVSSQVRSQVRSRVTRKSTRKSTSDLTEEKTGFQLVNTWSSVTSLPPSQTFSPYSLHAGIIGMKGI